MWILATITAIVAFVRLCKPAWRLICSPNELSKKLDHTDAMVQRNFDYITERFDQHEKELREIHTKLDKGDAINLSLLHDSIVQIYQRARDNHRIADDDYRRACDLYAQDGNSPYIDNLMGELREMHKTGVHPEK